MSKIKLLGIGVFLFLCLMTGCSKNDTKTSQNISPVPKLTPILTPAILPASDQVSQRNTMAKDEYPVVDGSTATIPLSHAVYQFFTGAAEEEAAADIVHTKTSNSYYRLMNREADLLIVYEPSEEVTQYMESNGYHLTRKPIGKDALVFMENAKNKVDSLSKQQLIDIYSGKYRNWSDVGGDNQEILAFQRPADSGSQTLMKKLVMGDTPMMEGSNVITYESMEGILKAMADYNNDGNTLGYSVFYYAKNMYQLPELKFMKVDGVEPSLETIYDNTYPFVNEFYAVIREDEPKDSNARLIFDWLTQEEGQTLVKDLGYVPVDMKFSDTSNSIGKETVLSLPKQYRYITATYNRLSDLSLGDVTIYDGKWQPVEEFHNSYADGKLGLVSENTMIPIGTAIKQKDGSFQVKYGLYRLSDRQFIIPQTYDSLTPIGVDMRFFSASRDGVNQVIDREEHVLATGFLQGEGFGVSQRGDYYWIYDYELKSGQLRYMVYDKDFKYIRTINQEMGDFNKLYDDDGTLLFSPELFYQHFHLKEAQEDNITVFGSNKWNSLLCILYRDKIMVLDRQLNMILEKTYNSSLGNYYIIYQNVIAEVQDNSEIGKQMYRFYDRNGKEIKDQKGNSYNNIVSNNYWNSYEKELPEIILYREKDHILSFLDYNEGSKIDEIDLGDWEDVTVDQILKDIVIVKKGGSDSQQVRVYKGNKLITQLQGNYYATVYNPVLTDRIILTNYDTGNGDNYYFIVIDDGDILYQSKYPEVIQSIDADYIQMNRGNYNVVIDYDGNYIIKQLSSSLAQD